PAAGARALVPRGGHRGGGGGPDEGAHRAPDPRHRDRGVPRLEARGAPDGLVAGRRGGDDPSARPRDLDGAPRAAAGRRVLRPRVPRREPSEALHGRRLWRAPPVALVLPRIAGDRLPAVDPL